MTANATRRHLYYHWRDGVPEQPGTREMLDTVRAERLILLNKHYFAPFGGGALGSIDRSTYFERIRNGTPDHSQPGLDDDYTGPVTIDAEHQWRQPFRHPASCDDDFARRAQGDLFRILDWTRDYLPDASVGLFQYFDLPHGSEPFARRVRMLADLCDEGVENGAWRVEPGCYHLWRGGHPDQERDAEIINFRISNAVAYGNGVIYLWMWHNYQGGSLIPEDAWEQWLQRWRGPEITGWILFGAQNCPANHVRIMRRVLEGS